MTKEDKIKVLEVINGVSKEVIMQDVDWQSLFTFLYVKLIEDKDGVSYTSVYRGLEDFTFKIECPGREYLYENATKRFSRTVVK